MPGSFQPHQLQEWTHCAMVQLVLPKQWDTKGVGQDCGWAWAAAQGIALALAWAAKPNLRPSAPLNHLMSSSSVSAL